MFKIVSQELLDFIKKSPSCFHAVENIKKRLESEGFEALSEGKPWKLQAGKNYYVTRNQSSIIAFKIPNKDFKGFNIVASHSDSPTFKLKENYEMEVDKKLVKLNVEKYGGMILSSWFDRPLSIAGRVVVKEGDFKLVPKLVDVDRDLVLIPNLAIHFNRNINDGYKYNPQVDMLPLYGGAASKGSLKKIVAEAVGCEAEDIVGSDLFLYNRMAPSIWGAEEEFISSPKLDNLQCAFATLKGFIAGENENTASIYCSFDNEEVGSLTKQGAESTFLVDVLKRINMSLGRSEEDYLVSIANSFMVSADNAHAVHPNKAEMSDQTNRPHLNEGVVIKYNANQKYTTDAVSAAVFTKLCKDKGVPYQVFANRSDVAGGSTLGNISNSKVSLNTIDIGLPQLAMHSAYESAGIKDTAYMCEIIEEFYNRFIELDEDGSYSIK